ncbi:hypothetical protein MTQ17_09775 [Corynebacterium bovis]|uniref:hypothetical protein n=1 Tax=Corynebacterium bovis TaxID=36808 RepID=UPI0031392763
MTKDWTATGLPEQTGGDDQGGDRPRLHPVGPVARDWTCGMGDGDADDTTAGSGAANGGDHATGQEGSGGNDHSGQVAASSSRDWAAPVGSVPQDGQGSGSGHSASGTAARWMSGRAQDVAGLDRYEPGDGQAVPRRGWVMCAAIFGIGAVVAGVGAIYAVGLTRDIDPVAAAPEPQTSVSMTPTAVPATTTRPRPAVDPDSNKVAVAGGCQVVDGQAVQEATQRSLRGTVVAFESEYFAHNAEGIPGLLHSSSSMLLPKKDRDALGDRADDPKAVRDAAVGYWRGVLDGVAPGSTWCLSMQPQSMNRVAASLEVTSAGQATTYHQLIDGVRGGDGKWQIKEIVAVDR